MQNFSEHLTAFLTAPSRSTSFEIKFACQSNKIGDRISLFIKIESDINVIREKIAGTKLESISLIGMKLANVPIDKFTDLMMMLSEADVQQLDLSRNDITHFDAQRTNLLFTVLQNKHLRCVYLNDMNFESLINKYQNQFVNFLNTTGLDQLSLKNNNLSDHSGSLLAKHVRMPYLDLGNNQLKDKSVGQFVGNRYITKLNLFANKARYETYQKVDRSSWRNQKNSYVEVLKVLAQGIKPGNRFAFLPGEIMLEIMMHIGSSFKKPEPVWHLCTLIIKNILAYSPGNLIWEKSLQTSKGPVTVFKTPEEMQESRTLKR